MTMKPIPHVILAVDAATASGWSIWLDGEIVAFGKASTRDPLSISSVCKHAVGLGQERGRKAVLVIEHSVFRGRSMRTAVGLGAKVGAWEIMWRQEGGHANKTIRVSPNEWRKPTIGVTRGPLIHKHEMAKATAVLGREPDTQDEAAAIVIGYWATYSSRVARKVPVGRVRK